MEQENQETKEELKQELERVNTEIGNYRSPITGCDEQFNYLLEMRSKMIPLHPMNVEVQNRKAFPHWYPLLALHPHCYNWHKSRCLL